MGNLLTAAYKESIKPIGRDDGHVLAGRERYRLSWDYTPLCLVEEVIGSIAPDVGAEQCLEESVPRNQKVPSSSTVRISCV